MTTDSPSKTIVTTFFQRGSGRQLPPVTRVETTGPLRRGTVGGQVEERRLPKTGRAIMTCPHH